MLPSNFHWHPYGRFEMAQKPAFILNITLAGHEVDVNLAPDKREVLIPAEGEIIGNCVSMTCANIC
jgi:DNA mismatch repair ATPase MutL